MSARHRARGEREDRQAGAPRVPLPPARRPRVPARRRQADGKFSIVTTEPNASVASVHDRMPLVLGPGESSVWLGSEFAPLADRRSVSLTSCPE
ncbi:SOS response-associated peptidase family protein [Candidatus Collinsella stercoripullorum]|uniref:SOS response-associated peptidase family protein n=1 Tax=Candidatus Collinsella stercoripullorum TaxID=2838522 RepID=UPI0022E7EFF2|nr:SOS response-associated peptidase family protein [Candidatus Collinsella stercoripullorum]